jgi:hypothetical protein
MESPGCPNPDADAGVSSSVRDAVDMAAHIKRRLGAVRLVLADLQGKPTHPHVSKIQAAALAQCIAGSELSIEDRSDFCGR